MIRDFSPEQLAAAKRLRGLPPAEYQQALYDYVGKGGSLTELLAMKAILDRQDAQTKAQDAVRMAVQGGANPAPQTTVAEDMMRKLGTGVSSLPVRSDMYDEANYAGGGIVAFDEGGGIYDQIRKAGRDWEKAAGVRAKPEDEYAPDVIPSVMEAVRQLPGQGYLRDIAGQAAAELQSPSITGLGRTMRNIHAIPGVTAFDWASRAGTLLGGLGSLGSKVGRGYLGLEETPPAASTRAPYVRPDEWDPRSTAGIRTVAPGAGPTETAPRAAPSEGGNEAAVSRTRPVSTLEMRGEDLQKVIEDQRKRVEKSVGEAPKPTTLEAQVQEATRLREKALKDAGVKSIKDRVNEISADAAQARNDRDADRWLAAAQGFFAMGAARSPWALKNISEGLGVTTTQLREVEKDYRKGEQLRKDRIAVLEEAKRQEALGNFDRGHELYKEAERIREKHAEKVMGVEATLLKSYETQLSQNIQQQAILEQKRAAVASAGAQKEYYAYLKEQDRRSKDVAAYNAAVQRTFDSLIKLNPVAMADPTGNAAETLRAQAVNHVLKTNPEFAKLAGVDTSTRPDPETLKKWTEIVQRNR